MIGHYQEHTDCGCMPNTPALIQAGMTALFATEAVSDQQRDITEKVMNAVGHVVWVEREDDWMP